MLINTTDDEVHMIDIETADIVRKFVGQRQGNFIIRSAFGGADENLVVSGSEGLYIKLLHETLLWNQQVLTPILFFRLESVHMAQTKRQID